MTVGLALRPGLGCRLGTGTGDRGRKVLAGHRRVAGKPEAGDWRKRLGEKKKGRV